MANTLVLYAHPNEHGSTLTRALAETADQTPDVEVRRLYDLYPDFEIAIEQEQAAVDRADHMIWLFPIYWYSCPALMKEWLDRVLQKGWAFGDKADDYSLRGKTMTLAVTSGGNAETYQPKAMHGAKLDQFLLPFERTAIFCQMMWRQRLWVQASACQDQKELAQALTAFRAELDLLRGKEAER